MPNLNVEVDQEEYDRLSEIKDAHGLTWKGCCSRGEIVGHRGAVVGRVETRTNAIPRPKGRGFLATAR